MSNIFYIESPYLSHHGIKGQRWGIRRFQNINGTLTPLGRKRVKKAMKLHDKILSAKSGSDYRKAQKKFTNFSRKLYSGETKELIKKIQEDNALRSVYEEKKSRVGRERIEQALKYTQSAASILSTAMTAYSTYATAKNTLAGIKSKGKPTAAEQKALAEARNTNAQAAQNEYNLERQKEKHREEKEKAEAEKEKAPKYEWVDMPKNAPKSKPKDEQKYYTVDADKIKNGADIFSDYAKKKQWDKKAADYAKNVCKDAFNVWASGKNEYSSFKKTAKQAQAASSVPEKPYIALPASTPALALPMVSSATEVINGKAYRKNANGSLSPL